jgi:hypothetical protein
MISLRNIIEKEVMNKMEKLECQICKKRQEAIDELDGCKTPNERESQRTATFDMTKYVFVSSGKREELEECCGVVVGSVTDSFSGKRSHHHTCVKCGKRFPEHGSYVGDWVNDNLKSDNPKFDFIGVKVKK